MRLSLVRLLSSLVLAALAWVSCSFNTLSQTLCCVIVEPADTNVTVMRSGGTFALQTRTRQVYFPPAPWAYSISFSFGFGTDEVPNEGEILDSITLVMENTNTVVSAVLFTADASGFSWLPFTPGLLPLLEADLAFAPASFQDIQPLPTKRVAYQVTFAVPRVLAKEWADLKLVLYDYPNGLNSVGWLGAVTVIPPPGVLEEISPTNLFRPLGPPGGSFVPISRTYSLTNSGGQTLSWRVTPSANWLTASPSNGTLDPGAITNVSVAVNNRARNFQPGIYAAEIAFNNAFVETNSAVRLVQLTVPALPSLEATRPQVAGQFQLRLRATPLVNYRIEASTDFASWLPVRTNATDVDGTFIYSESANRPYRFFRASFVNP